MKKMINIRNSVIIILCITIICMAIGFIVISVDYTKKNNEDSSYNVSFTNIKKLSSVKGSTIEPKGKVKISDNEGEIEMQISMNAPHDELSYMIEVENKGTLPVEILDILESPDYSLASMKNLINPVTITLSDVKGKIIPPHEKLNLKVVFYYNSGDKTPKTFDYKIGLITRSR